MQSQLATSWRCGSRSAHGESHTQLLGAVSASDATHFPQAGIERLFGLTQALFDRTWIADDVIQIQDLAA